MSIHRTSGTIRDSVVDNNGAMQGGGLYVLNATAYIIASNITGNMASTCSLYDETCSGGGLYLMSSVLSTQRSIFDGNRAQSCGAGIYVQNSTADISFGTVNGNLGTSIGFGGGIYITYSNVTMDATSITNNAGFAGGGVAVTYSSTLEMNGCTCSGNNASSTTGTGGCAYINGTTFMSKETTYTNNHARASGGALYSIGSDSIRSILPSFPHSPSIPV